MRRTLAVVLCLAVTGCGPLSQTHHRPGNSHEVATSAPSPAPGEPHAAITVVAGKVRPPSGWLELRKGQTVSITVTSDVADELHVHGFDVKAALPAGKPVTVRFAADMTGVFEVETHGGKLVLLQLAVK